MALAALYATAIKSNKFLPRPHGFIVDHKVRPESTEEAEWVAEQLRKKCTLHDHSLSPWQSLMKDSPYGLINTHTHMA
jgi:hypothetical protein